MVLGDPFTVDGKLYTPVDKLNYDEVGTAMIDSEGGEGVTAANRILPLPSYVEVTSLETGRTILVRNEKRGPMTGAYLIGLSPAAADQLGITRDTPVRVRRVNPPEQDRALLRQGARAPERMDTPMSLVAVLKRKLPGQAIAPAMEAVSQKVAPPAPVEPVVAVAAPQPDPAPGAPVLKPADVPPSVVAKAPEPVAPPKPATPALAPEKGLVVQAGAFSVEANAEKAAKQVSGKVEKPGKFYLVRTGPFASRGEAEASLAKVKAAGYSGALIKTLN